MFPNFSNLYNKKYILKLFSLLRLVSIRSDVSNTISLIPSFMIYNISYKNMNRSSNIRNNIKIEYLRYRNATLKFTRSHMIEKSSEQIYRQPVRFSRTSVGDTFLPMRSASCQAAPTSPRFTDTIRGYPPRGINIPNGVSRLASSLCRDPLSTGGRTRDNCRAV